MRFWTLRTSPVVIQGAIVLRCRTGSGDTLCTLPAGTLEAQQERLRSVGRPLGIGQAATDLGFTMEPIRSHRFDEEQHAAA